jgi:chromosome segregation ATPase
MLNEYYKDKVNQRDYELRMATHKLNETNSRLESLLNKFLDEEVTIDTYNDKKEKLENDKIELEEEISALKQ